LQHIEIGLATGDDADLGLRPAAIDDAVEAVGLGIGDGGEALEIVQTAFLLEPVIGGADIEAARRHGEVGGDHRLDAVEPSLDRGRRLHRIMHAFDADPAAGETRQRETVEAVVEKLLDAGGAEDRHHRVEQREFRLMRHGRGLSAMIVARHHQHAAMLGGACRIGVAHHIARAVDTGTLAVPDAEDAVIGALAAHLGLLRAPERGGGKVLVDAGMEFDVVRIEPLRRAHEGLIDAADRRAAIAGDIARRVEPGAPVELLLHQRQAHHGLRPGDMHPRLREIVFVVEAIGHGPSVAPAALGLKVSLGTGKFKGFDA
jgi:hypothetical protein